VSVDLEDILLLGLAGMVGYTLVKRSSASAASEATTQSIARMAPADPAIVVAPTLVVDPYPDYFGWGWGPSVNVWNFGGGRRGGRGGHHHRGGGRRGRR